MLRGIIFILLCIMLLFPGYEPVYYAQTISWNRIEEGLHLCEILSPQRSEQGDSRIVMIKIDPRHYQFKLLCANEYDQKLRTVRQWAEEFSLVAAVNAGMYQQDHFTSVGFMKNFDHVNNPSLNNNNTIFAFNPVDSSLKAAQIIDRTCQDFESLRTEYHCFLQSIRMISCSQQNVWVPQAKKWSMVVLAVDQEDQILFIFTQSPYSVHEFINILLSLPISIYNAMYLEGGSEASLYFSANDLTLEKSGDFARTMLQGTKQETAWPVPNVLGIVKRAR